MSNEILSKAESLQMEMQEYIGSMMKSKPHLEYQDWRHCISFIEDCRITRD